MNTLAQELDELTEAPSHAGEAGVLHPAARFEIVDATDGHDDPTLVAEWRSLLARGAGPEKLYQTPEFFRYMVEAEEGAPRSYALYAVRRRSDGACVGVIPVRRSEQAVDFRLGPLRLGGRKLKALQVLGSVPLLDRSEPGLPAFVLATLLHRHPDCALLSMQAVPAAGLAALGRLPGLAAHVHNGLRDCHTVPLPEHFDAYLQKFSSKKRYNLSRQVRLLGQQAGEVQVRRVEEPQQVPGLVEAIRGVFPPAMHGQLAQQKRLERLAKYGLLHSYVIQCGSEDVAVVLGTRSGDVWHVHNIGALPKYAALSAGTSAVHLALQDTITHFSFADADFGYGSPNQEFRATHVLKPRATVLVCRARGGTSALLAAHGVFARAAELMATQVKAARRWLDGRRRASRAAAEKPVAEKPVAVKSDAVKSHAVKSQPPAG